MTSQQFLVCDCSTVANFKQWASAISGAFSAFGWVQTADTGQVNWSTISSVPGANAYVYEIWKPGDALTPFYVRVEYGNWGPQGGTSTNSPSIKVSIADSTSGGGVLTGLHTQPLTCANRAITPPSASTGYECDFSGTSARIGALLWRNGPNPVQQLFAIERSINSSGAYTSAYVTLIVAGAQQNSNDWARAQQQTVVFGVGVTNTINREAGSGQSIPPLCVRRANPGVGISSAFNNAIPIDTVAPCVGYFDWPMTVVGAAAAQDVTEGIVFTTTVYGASHNYMPHSASDMGSIFYTTGNSAQNAAICLRYD